MLSKTACEDILSFAELFCTAYKTQLSAKLKVIHLVIKNIILCQTSNSNLYFIHFDLRHKHSGSLLFVCKGNSQIKHSIFKSLPIWYANTNAMMKLCSFWKTLNLQQNHVGRLSQAYFKKSRVWMSDFEMSKEQGMYCVVLK